MRKVLVIGGPTAAGKSDFALEVASLFQGEIVNADSVQIYRGMDIGTAKPPPEVRGILPHHLFDVAILDDPWDVKRYEEKAVEVVEEVLSRGKLPVVVGGSGFYIKGLLEGVPPEVPSDRGLRERLLQKDPYELYRELQKVDPERAKVLHPHDVKRVVRALEIYYLTGVPPSRFRWEGRDRWDVLKIALDRERGELRERIYRRTETMLKDGWLDEVRSLIEEYGMDNRLLRETLGYRELVWYLEGRFSFDEAARRIKVETYRYSKRQRRWFRKEGFSFFYPGDRERILELIGEWLDDKDNGGRG